jgi:malonyl-CoA O-methyltransferase
MPRALSAAAAPDKRAVRRSYERAAGAYDAHAVLHREVGKRLIEHLDPIRLEPRRIVDLGCGTGAGFEALARRFPRAELLGIDFAQAMLERARRRVPAWRRWLGRPGPKLVCADAERLPLANACAELVVSNLALQWCEASHVFVEAARVLPAGGLFLFSTLGPDTLKELRAAFRLAGDASEHVNEFVDMHDLGDALGAAGFADPVMEMEAITLEYRDLGALARDLKAVGAHNVLGGRPRGLFGRARWERVAAGYEPLRREGVLPASYEVVYGHAWKTAPRRLADGRQVVDLVRRERP